MFRIVLPLLLISSSLFSQTKFEFWPGTTYDPAVPTMRTVVGYDPGDHISPHANVLRYMEALAAAEPRRMKIFEYGKTWEGRRLIYAVIGSEANIRRLDEIKAGMLRLSDPRKTNEAAARALTASLPVIVWLSYGVHGNEISSCDSAMMTAYHLLAARNNKMVADILAKELVIIDPLQNPDGRDRFVHGFEMGEGLEPDPNPLAAEHTEPWPGGRTNHYYFDMNRDWVALTQPETKGRVAAMLEWRPQVAIDLHEMGTDSTYYFAPPADPFNPNMTAWQRDYQTDLGKGNAKWFDQFGFSYFTRDTYDAFYPGYGDSWPVYLGAIAATYENGSTRGLVVKRPNELVVTYRDTVRRHFVSSLATCETSAAHHDELMAHFYEYGRTGVEEGTTGPVREYILPWRGNTSAVDKLAQLLVEQGVEVQRASAAFTTEGKAYPAGSYLVSLVQPQKRRVKNLLDLNTLMDDKFLKGEEERRKRRLSSQIYDVTAWSIPLQFNVESIPSAVASSVASVAVKLGDTPPGRITGGKAAVAYLVPWGTSGAGRVMTGAMRAGLRIYGADKGFTVNGREYPAGSLIVPVKENPESVHDTMAQLARVNGIEVVATATSWVDDGPNFGSRYAPFLKKPAVAMAWDRPTSAGSAGETRFVLERQFGYPVTPVRTQQLGSADLSQFQVIILPDGGSGDGGYAEVLGVSGVQRLKQWVADGGTVIGIGTAVQFLADSKTGLLAIQQENRVPEKDSVTPPTARAATTAEATPTRPAGKTFATDSDFDKAIQPDSELPTSLRGALVKCRVDKEQWITAGLPDTVYAMVSGSAIFTPVKIDRGANAVTFAGPDDLLASGYMWDEYRKQLAYKPLVVVSRSGRGLVVAFTADPNYRAALDGLNMLFLNAVFRGPAHGGAGGRGAE
ncbi:MAG: M14 family metallopeptidase [Acidobacteriota bacterium]|nr:M14 family metallopeptidase [Acidobacteriota bacterium]